MSKKRLVLCQAGFLLGMIATLGFTTDGIAEIAPRRGVADPRVRMVNYNPVNVVSVDATHGVSTMIVLGDSEKIETVAVGDSVSWKIEPNKRGNIIFLKPVEAKTVTNMNVVSDKRVYTFILRARAESDGDQTFMVKFRYPDEEMDADLLEKARKLASQPNRDNFRHDDSNTDYRFRGDATLKPKNAFDDGVKTWFRFDGDIPSIFIVEGGKREILANFRREGDYIVVDKIARQWMLRRGDDALCLFNLRKVGANESPMADASGSAVRRIN
ncbi:P-type conjugative transfer protein VirB9 [Phyllobacterium sp. YR531]|uniref:P-type conjugative transfer protein VirB9 n=1 Tax=Phyllobacterium sp. YR531 TaxID=1144343 RepID=UPI00026F642C|nr:P-type conjugative transfer protein VirB9 [Phyllobacterium sp. YR531]EJN02769.1 P-type conjugative transfer protein VirB9 [Phyllobacterium sp. YR531]